MLVRPGDDKLAVVETGYRWIILIIGMTLNIGSELVADGVGVAVKPLAVNIIVPTIIILVVRLPGDNKTAIRKRRDRRVILVLVGRAVDPELFADRRAGVGEQLTADIVVLAAIMTT